MITVYQAHWARMEPELQMRIMVGADQEAIKEAWEKGLYRDVAVVNTRALDTAYMHTNTISGSWFVSPTAHPDGQPRTVELEVSDWAVEGCRSTSVGDVMLGMGQYHVVASCGFTEIQLGRLGGLQAHREAAKKAWDLLVTVDWEALGYPQLDKQIPFAAIRLASELPGEAVQKALAQMAKEG